MKDCSRDFYLLKLSKLCIRDHSFSTYAKFSEKLTFLDVRTRAHQEVNVSFSENFAYILNEWPYT